jgi:DNA gyrase/topoisomerase IV subunit A
MSDVQKTYEVKKAIGIDASDLIRDHHIEYGEDIFKNHFPQIGDGLKTLYRRILWALQDTDDSIKATAAIALVMKYHPHGDTSIYDGIVRLGAYLPDPKNKSAPREGIVFNPPLLKAIGNMADPNFYAAPRYTNVAMGEFGRDLFFKGIEKASIPITLNSDGFIEPLYLIPAIPTNLYFGNTTVGFGHGSKLPPRNFNEVCDLAIAYCDHIGKFGFDIQYPFEIGKHASKLLPDFYMDNVILNEDALLKAYRLGEFDHEIIYTGSVILTKDTIHIKSLPYGSSKSAYEKLQALLLDRKMKNSFLDQNITDIMDEPDRATVYLKKNSVSVFEVWHALKQHIEFTTSFHPNYNYCTPNGHLNIDVDVNVLLEVWYKRRSSLILGTKRRQLERLAKAIRIVDARLNIIENTDKALRIIRNNDMDNAIQLLMKSFKLSYSQADYIVTSRLSILTKTGRQELLDEHVRLKEKFKELQDSFHLIPKEIISDILDLKKKYHRTRITKVPHYVGCVKLGSGYAQISDFSELETLLLDFPRVPTQVIDYQHNNVMVIDRKGRVLQNPKEKYGEGDIYLTPPSFPHTVHLAPDKTGMCVKGIVPYSGSGKLFYASLRSKIVYKDGWVKSEKITDVLSVRKTISRGAKTDIIAVYPNYLKEHFIVIVSDKDLNVLTLYRVPEGSEAKLVMNQVGMKHVIAHETGKDWYLDIPDKYLTRGNVRLFNIIDAHELLGTNNRTRIEVTASKWRRHSLFNVISY